MDETQTLPPWPEQHPRLVGLGLLLVLHALLIVGPIEGISGLKPEAEPLFIGVLQLWYVVPASIFLYALEWRRTLKAFITGALITFGLNLAACGTVVWIFSQAKW